MIVYYDSCSFFYAFSSFRSLSLFTPFSRSLFLDYLIFLVFLSLSHPLLCPSCIHSCIFFYYLFRSLFFLYICFISVGPVLYFLRFSCVSFFFIILALFSTYYFLSLLHYRTFSFIHFHRFVHVSLVYAILSFSRSKLL